jgi:GT2 family glycosyltransferase
MSDRIINMATTLSISCVTYNTHQGYLTATLTSLVSACLYAKNEQVLGKTHLYLIDNGPDEKNALFLQKMCEEFSDYFDSIELISGHGNLGYGRANNLAIMSSNCDYHLVLNPDVVLADDNLAIAIDFLRTHPDVGLLAPDAKGEDFQRQYIAKRTPSFCVLLSRALNSKIINALFQKQLHSYECRDFIPALNPVDIMLASGCYMLMPRDYLQQLGGFDPDFFMYFEDYNLSQRMARARRVVHHPKVKIVHFGGGAAGKGGGHIRLFLSSYLRFVYKSIYLKYTL